MNPLKSIDEIVSQLVTNREKAEKQLPGENTAQIYNFGIIYAIEFLSRLRYHKNYLHEIRKGYQTSLGLNIMLPPQYLQRINVDANEIADMTAGYVERVKTTLNEEFFGVPQEAIDKMLKENYINGPEYTKMRADAAASKLVLFRHNAIRGVYNASERKRIQYIFDAAFNAVLTQLGNTPSSLPMLIREIYNRKRDK